MYPLTFHTGDGLEGLSELPPEQAVVKLQRQNARLRRKAEAAMALEQENASLKSQLHDMASQMVRWALQQDPDGSFWSVDYQVCAYMLSLELSIIWHRDVKCFIFSVPLLQATKVADEMADESTKAGTSSPDKVLQCFYCQACVCMMFAQRS